MVIHPSCSSCSDGKIIVTIKGPYRPYKFSIDNGQNWFNSDFFGGNTKTFENLPEGLYNVLVATNVDKDNFSCILHEVVLLKYQGEKKTDVNLCCPKINECEYCPNTISSCCGYNINLPYHKNSFFEEIYQIKDVLPSENVVIYLTNSCCDLENSIDTSANPAYIVDKKYFTFDSNNYLNIKLKFNLTNHPFNNKCFRVVIVKQGAQKKLLYFSPIYTPVIYNRIICEATSTELDDFYVPKYPIIRIKSPYKIRENNIDELGFTYHDDSNLNLKDNLLLFGNLSLTRLEVEDCVEKTKYYNDNGLISSKDLNEDYTYLVVKKYYRLTICDLDNYTAKRVLSLLSDSNGFEVEHYFNKNDKINLVKNLRLTYEINKSEIVSACSEDIWEIDVDVLEETYIKSKTCCDIDEDFVEFGIRILEQSFSHFNDLSSFKILFSDKQNPCNTSSNSFEVTVTPPSNLEITNTYLLATLGNYFSGTDGQYIIENDIVYILSKKSFLAQLIYKDIEKKDLLCGDQIFICENIAIQVNPNLNKQFKSFTTPFKCCRTHKKNSSFYYNNSEINTNINIEPCNPDINTDINIEPCNPDINTDINIEPCSPDINTDINVEPCNPDINTDINVEPCNPDINTDINVEPCNPDINTDIKIEPCSPDVNTNVVVEPCSPDVNTDINIEPCSPDVSTNLVVEPCSPDVNTNVVVEPCSADINTNLNIEPCNPDINANVFVEPCNPDINANFNIEPCSSDINTNVQIEPCSPDVNTNISIDPCSPDINTNVQIEPCSPDINTSVKIEPCNPDINTNVKIEPCSPDVNTEIRIEPCASDVSTNINIEPCSPDLNTNIHIEPCSPDINTNVKIEPCASDINTQINVEPCSSDINTNIAIQPCNPDVNTNINVEPCNPEVSANINVQPCSPEINSYNNIRVEPCSPDVTNVTSVRVEPCSPNVNNVTSVKVEPCSPDVTNVTSVKVEPCSPNINNVFNVEPCSPNLESEINLNVEPCSPNINNNINIEPCPSEVVNITTVSVQPCSSNTENNVNLTVEPCSSNIINNINVEPSSAIINFPEEINLKEKRPRKPPQNCCNGCPEGYFYFSLRIPIITYQDFVNQNLQYRVYYQVGPSFYHIYVFNVNNVLPYYPDINNEYLHTLIIDDINSNIFYNGIYTNGSIIFSVASAQFVYTLIYIPINLLTHFNLYGNTINPCDDNFRLKTYISQLNVTETKVVCCSSNNNNNNNNNNITEWQYSNNNPTGNPGRNDPKYHINTSDSSIWYHNGSNWVNLGKLCPNCGGSGGGGGDNILQWFYSSSDPSEPPISNLSYPYYHHNTSDNTFWYWNGTRWIKIGKICPNCDGGKTELQWVVDRGEPVDPPQGPGAQFYLNDNDSSIYVWSGTSWVLKGKWCPTCNQGNQNQWKDSTAFPTSPPATGIEYNYTKNSRFKHHWNGSSWVSMERGPCCPCDIRILKSEIKSFIQALINELPTLSYCNQGFISYRPNANEHIKCFRFGISRNQTRQNNFPFSHNSQSPAFNAAYGYASFSPTSICSKGAFVLFVKRYVTCPPSGPIPGPPFYFYLFVHNYLGAYHVNEMLLTSQSYSNNNPGIPYTFPHIFPSPEDLKKAVLNQPFQVSGAVTLVDYMNLYAFEDIWDYDHNYLNCFDDVSNQNFNYTGAYKFGLKHIGIDYEE